VNPSISLPSILLRVFDRAFGGERLPVKDYQLREEYL
jgi:hypothetical protein